MAKGSIKHRIMSELTKGSSKCTASFRWKETICQQHEEAMIKLLKDACNIAE